MTTLRSSCIAFVGILFALSASSVSAMSCAIDVNGKTTCPTSEQVDELRRASEPVACTMDAKACPDGSYVGRIAPNCEFAECLGTPSCAPYKCMDGTTHPSCSEDGHVINYFAPPCLTHGGDAGPFTDVPANDEHANAIAYLKEHGIVQGYADGTYKPDQTINRAEFLKILLQAETSLYDGDGMAPTYAAPCFMHETKQQFISKYGKFPDVGFDSWYGGYFCSATRMTVIQGYPDGTFRPANDINFVEAAKIIYSLNHFDYDYWNATDIGVRPVDSDPWYRAYVDYLEGEHAIPLSIESFDQRITRGEMAEMIWRLKANVTDLPSKTYEQLGSSENMPSPIYALDANSPTTLSNYSRNVIYRYTVSAPQAGSASVMSQQFTLSGGRWSDPQLRVYSDGYGAGLLDTWESNDNWTEGDGAVLQGDAIVIPAGGTRYIELSARIGTPADMGFTVTVQLPGLPEMTLQDR